LKKIEKNEKVVRALVPHSFFMSTYTSDDNMALFCLLRRMFRSLYSKKMANKRLRSGLPSFDIDDFSESKECMCCGAIVPPAKIGSHSFVCGLMALMQSAGVDVENFFFVTRTEIEAHLEQRDAVAQAKDIESYATQSLSSLSRGSPSPVPQSNRLPEHSGTLDLHQSTKTKNEVLLLFTQVP